MLSDEYEPVWFVPIPRFDKSARRQRHLARAAAQAEGCAFFDTWTAMGGEGSAGRWFKREPKLMGGDLGHATGKGHQVIGELFYRAVIEAYVAYRKRGVE